VSRRRSRRGGQRLAGVARSRHAAAGRRRSDARWVGLAALLALALATAGRPAAAADATYTLQAQAMAVIQRLCERLQPQLRCAAVGIDHDHVLMRLCGAAAAPRCFALRLEHPAPDCDDTHWGPFCARFPNGRPAAAVIARLAEALQASGEPDPWTRLEPPPTPAPPPTTSAPPLPSSPSAAPSAEGPSPASVARSLAIAAALTIVPVVVGWSLGRVWRRRRGGRGGGVAVAILTLVIPAAALLLLDAQLELLGAWDAVLIGLGVGAGLLLAAHRAAVDRRQVALLLGSSLVALLLAELASRLLLPPPSAFPSASGPTLWLSDALRTARATGFSASQAGASSCEAIYGGGTGRNTTPPVVFPATWQPRADAAEHILHLGDSMVFGPGTENGRFTADLERLEPRVEHVNGAIAGTAPDVYLALARRFIARHDFTAVVMHLTGNDLSGIDERQYPCSDWQSLLVYEPAGTRLRFATAQQAAGGGGRLEWFVRVSPPPYVLRAGVRFSALAAHLAAALVQLSRHAGGATAAPDDAEPEAHLRAILRDARDELRARHIPLLVDSFPNRLVVESGRRAQAGDEETMQRIARELGIVTLDAWQPLFDAVQRGGQPFSNAGGATDSHFNRTGHALIAAWLHEQLPGAMESARRAGEAQPTPPADAAGGLRRDTVGWHA